jgi:hypothetical protein
MLRPLCTSHATRTIHAVPGETKELGAAHTREQRELHQVGEHLVLAAAARLKQPYRFLGL